LQKRLKTKVKATALLPVCFAVSHRNLNFKGKTTDYLSNCH